MTLALTITLIAALLIGVGTIGIVYPILPGSLAVLTGLVLWGLIIRGAEGWSVLIAGALLVLAGMAAQAVLTGHTMKKRQIPNRSILWGVAGAVIGMFLIPVVGLFIGFATALFVSESVRQGNIQRAIPDTLAALKSMGLGMLVELICALAAGIIFTIGAIVYFITL